jgi:decaprenyl-phosphate phosphoribosyltransferase
MSQTSTRPEHPAGAGAGGGGAPKPTRRGSVAWALLVGCRPKQWLKNLLVFSALAASGLADHPPSVARSAVAFAVLCLASSGTYLLNDVRDRHADRLHPRKARRPVAAGRVSVGAALVAGVLLIATCLAVAAGVGPPAFVVTVTCYLALSTAYSLGLKNLPVVDVAAVAGCHVIRAIAGAVVIGVPMSSWLLLVVSLISLLLVVGKREAELGLGAPEGTRATLRTYSWGYLAQLRAMASGAVLVTYSQWAIGVDTMPSPGFRELSIVPFALVVMRVNLVMEQGPVEEPEELVLRDRPLQVFLGCTALCAFAGVYL